MIEMKLSDKQKYYLNKLWHIYGNNGKKHSHCNHRYIQNFIEHDEDTKQFYLASPKNDLTEECMYDVDTVLRMATSDILVTAYGKITRAWTKHKKYGYGCAECCNGDRCDENCRARYNRKAKNCPHCMGEGWIRYDSNPKEFFPFK